MSVGGQVGTPWVYIGFGAWTVKVEIPGSIAPGAFPKSTTAAGQRPASLAIRDEDRDETPVNIVCSGDRRVVYGPRLDRHSHLSRSPADCCDGAHHGGHGSHRGWRHRGGAECLASARCHGATPSGTGDHAHSQVETSAANNSILIVEFVEQLRERGHSILEAAGAHPAASHPDDAADVHPRRHAAGRHECVARHGELDSAAERGTSARQVRPRRRRSRLRRRRLAPDPKRPWPISMCRKRSFATHRRGRRPARAAACRIPCLILCVADVARTSCPSNARLQSKEYDRRRTRTPAHHGGPGARGLVRGGTQVAFGIAAENTGAQDRDQGRAGGLRSQALASAARCEGR